VLRIIAWNSLWQSEGPIRIPAVLEEKKESNRVGDGFKDVCAPTKSTALGCSSAHGWLTIQTWHPWLATTRSRHKKWSEPRDETAEQDCVSLSGQGRKRQLLGLLSVSSSGGGGGGAHTCPPRPRHLSLSARRPDSNGSPTPRTSHTAASSIRRRPPSSCLPTPQGPYRPTTITAAPQSLSSQVFGCHTCSTTPSQPSRCPLRPRRARAGRPAGCGALVLLSTHPHPVINIYQQCSG
jgi:hypothetical protein